MADLLRARGVTLDPIIEGGELPGGEARTAWECFTQMAAEPAYEPFVNRSGTRLRAAAAPGGPRARAPPRPARATCSSTSPAGRRAGGTTRPRWARGSGACSLP